MVLKRLTNYQKSVLNCMEEDNSLIYTTEGSNYKCWLHFKDGTKKIIRKDTCNILYELGYIKEKDGVSSYYFVYCRTAKKIV